ncbi:MAG: ABC transporter permease [Chitinophagaceae bacterium]
MEEIKQIPPTIEIIQEGDDHWTEVIRPKSGLFDLRLGEVWRYRDLVMMFVKRDIVANYKQTILGPIWIFLQPIMTSLMYVIVFGNIAGISTDGVPKILFYLAGVMLWNYFSECFNKTATVFKDNASIFGKVYFPRLVMPLALVVSNLVKLLIQFALFLVFFGYFFYKGEIHPNAYILFFPLLILLLAGISLGTGMIISSLTTKYRDLIFLLTFGVQLFMYATPVIYPLSVVAAKYPKMVGIIKLNPLTSIMETFRKGFLGNGDFSWGSLGYSAAFTMVLLAFGTVIFNKVEKNFMDTV